MERHEMPHSMSCEQKCRTRELDFRFALTWLEFEKKSKRQFPSVVEDSLTVSCRGSTQTIFGNITPFLITNRYMSLNLLTSIVVDITCLQQSLQWITTRFIVRTNTPQEIVFPIPAAVQPNSAFTRPISNSIINKFLYPRSIKSLFNLCLVPRNYLFFPKKYSPKWENDSHSPATCRSSPDTLLVHFCQITNLMHWFL
jgi:hypothetical protein